MEHQSQDTLRQGLFDFERIAPWVHLPEKVVGGTPMSGSEREGQMFAAWREELNWEERLLEQIADSVNLEVVMQRVEKCACWEYQR